jgi:hypothetical protein
MGALGAVMARWAQRAAVSDGSQPPGLAKSGGPFKGWRWRATTRDGAWLGPGDLAGYGRGAHCHPSAGRPDGALPHSGASTLGERTHRLGDRHSPGSAGRERDACDVGGVFILCR